MIAARLVAVRTSTGQMDEWRLDGQVLGGWTNGGRMVRGSIPEVLLQYFYELQLESTLFPSTQLFVF